MKSARRMPLLLAALALAGCAADADRPGMQVLPGMVDSGLVKSFDLSPLGGGAPALLLPPQGTVAVERAVFPYGPGPEEAKRAGLELVNPLAASPAELARGRQVFETTCAVCHGARGAGDGPIVGRFPNPPSLTAARARSLPDGQLFHIITRGQGVMPSHAAQVLAEDRWRAVLYVRELQGAPAKETP